MTTKTASHPLRGNVEPEYSDDLVDRLGKSFSVYLSRPYQEVEDFITAMKEVFDRHGNVEDIIQVQEAFGCYPGNPYVETHNLVESFSYCGKILDDAKKSDSKGIPTIPFIAWPKSGSSYIATMLCYGLGLSAARISWRDKLPVKSWIRALGRFPAVTHEHIYPSEDLAKPLVDSGIRKIVVHSRDARQALASMARFFVKHSEMRLSYTSINPDEGITSVAQQYLDRGFITHYTQWHMGWRALTKDFDIHFTDYDAFFRDPLRGLEEVMAFLGVSDAAISDAVRRIAESGDALHFNFDVGRADSWQDVLTPDQTARILDEVPNEVVDTWGRSP